MAFFVDTLARLKKGTRHALHAIGWELHRYRPSSDPDAMLAALLSVVRADVVVDVGANRGQFGKGLRRAGYRERLLSIEPLEGAHRALVETARGDSLWTVVPCCAAGAVPGQLRMNISANSVSSSLLPSTPQLLLSAPEAAFVGSQLVSVRPLDEIFAQHAPTANAPFIKIDTQGFEWDVLDGARSLLESAVGLSVEASLVPLYEGQHLWLEIVERLCAQGFAVWGVYPAFNDRMTGRTLQVDLYFARESKSWRRG